MRFLYLSKLNKKKFEKKEREKNITKEEEFKWFEKKETNKETKEEREKKGRTKKERKKER